MNRGELARTDAWGRPPPPVLPKLPWVAARRPEVRWALVVLRGFVFIPGILLTLVVAFALAFSGNLFIVLAQLVMAPAALVCWVQASGGKGGDRWTAGYVALWVLEVVLLKIGSLII